MYPEIFEQLKITQELGVNEKENQNAQVYEGESYKPVLKQLSNPAETSERGNSLGSRKPNNFR